MSNSDQREWLLGRKSLAAAGGWKEEEVRLVADLGYALAEQGRNHEALTIFEGLAALAPAASYFQSALGALWLRLDEPRRAIEHLDAALEAEMKDVSALVNRGEAYLELGDLASAQRDLQAAVRTGATSEESAVVSSVVRAGALLRRLRTLEAARDDDTKHDFPRLPA